MKKIFNMMSQDLTTALRDNLLIILILFPLLYSFGVKALVPSVEESSYTYAVMSSVSPQTVEKLKDLGRIETFDRIDTMNSRVEGLDDVMGVYEEDGKLYFVFEGNETESSLEVFNTVIDSLTLDLMEADIRFESTGDRKSILYDVLAIVLVMLAILIGGVTSGFNMVYEKETKAINAIAVSPLRFRDFILARGVFAISVEIVMSMLSALIVTGRGVNYLYLLLSVLFSCMIAVLIALFTGGLANNQITAIAVLKLLFPAYLTFPIVSIFVNEKWHFFFYVLPNYWQFQMLKNIFMKDHQKFDFWTSALMTLLTGSLAFAILQKTFKRKFGLR